MVLWRFVFPYRKTGLVEVEGEELTAAPLHTYMWKAFNNWLTGRTDDPEHLLRLLEVSELLNRRAYNDIFVREIDRLITQIDDPEMESKLANSRGIDWVGYVARSLRNAGFQTADIDPLTHEIVVRLLVQPGALFRKWNGQPIDARFKLAVRNAVLNLVEIRRSRRRFASAEAVPEIAARSSPNDESAIEEFRTLVRERLGELALSILDVRLEGGDVKSLAGSGGPSSYRIKQIVQAIKALAAEFGDEDFRAMVEKAMAGERETARRRFGVTGAA